MAPPDIENSVWRHGDLLVARRDAVLPSRCIRCDSEVKEVDVRINLVASGKASPHSRSLAGKTAFLLSAQRATLVVGLCPDCRSRRRRLIGSLIAVMILGAVTLGTLITLSETGHVSTGNSWFPGVAVASAVVAIFPVYVIAFWLPLVKPEFIDEEIIAVNGVDPKLLSRLPQYPA